MVKIAISIAILSQEENQMSADKSAHQSQKNGHNIEGIAKNQTTALAANRILSTKVEKVDDRVELLTKKAIRQENLLNKLLGMVGDLKMPSASENSEKAMPSAAESPEKATPLETEPKAAKTAATHKKYADAAAAAKAAAPKASGQPAKTPVPAGKAAARTRTAAASARADSATKLPSEHKVKVEKVETLHEETTGEPIEISDSDDDGSDEESESGSEESGEIRSDDDDDEEESDDDEEEESEYI